MNTKNARNRGVYNICYLKISNSWTHNNNLPTDKRCIVYSTRMHQHIKLTDTPRFPNVKEAKYGLAIATAG